MRRRRLDVFTATRCLEHTPTVALRGLQALSRRVERAVERAALLPAQMSGLRELLREALVRAEGMEDSRAPVLLHLHDPRVLELLDEGLLAPAGTVSAKVECKAGEKTHW